MSSTQTTTLNCSNCQAPLNGSPNVPTLTCNYCGTVMQNPLYHPSGDAPPMPQININITNTTGAAPQPAPAMYNQQAVQYQPKSWLATTLLCFFLGFFGAHRFYTGHIVFGAIQFFTGGGFFIWAFVDFIMIITGSYRDKNGQPLQRGENHGKIAAVVIILFLVMIFISSLTQSPTPA